MNSKLFGFTLAEVLLTLLIIGIVASIVIPQLINDTQNAELNTAWKKAFGSASQAYILAVIDNGGGFGPYTCYGREANDYSLVKFNAIKNQLRVIKECYGNTYGNCWAPQGVTPYPTASGCQGFSKSGQNNTRAFVTADGMSWLLYGNNPVSYCSLIAVDINGPKPPNQWRKDVFSFGVEDKKINTWTCY